MDADARKTSAPDSAHSPGGRLPPDDEHDGQDEPLTSPNEAMHAAAVHFKELKEYISYYVAAKKDGISATFRNLGLMIGLGLLGLLVGGGILVTAAVLLLTGLAGGIGAIFDRPWLGQLIVGFVLVAGVMGAALWFYMRSTKAARERTVKKYELRKRQQREQFRTDVAERAKDTGQ